MNKKTIVVNIKKTKEYDVYIGRPSKWGNHYRLADYSGDRQLVLAMFQRWLLRPAQKEFREEVRRELAGKRLGCFCEPASCHGHVYVDLIEGKLGDE